MQITIITKDGEVIQIEKIIKINFDYEIKNENYNAIIITHQPKEKIKKALYPITKINEIKITRNKKNDSNS